MFTYIHICIIISLQRDISVIVEVKLTLLVYLNTTNGVLCCKLHKYDT